MEYTLFENKLTKDNEDDFIAKHVNSIIENSADLLETITGPGSILKETESKAVIEAYWKTIIKYIQKGHEYRDEWISVSLNIAGTFENKDARFDRESHEIRVGVVPNKRIKKAAREINPHYVDPDFDRAIIENIYDFASDTDNDTLSPGGVVEVKGRNLKIHEGPVGAGVFLINKESGDEVVIQKMRDNEPRTLRFVVPTLEAGTYRLEIRNSARESRKLRIGTSELEYTIR
ncbi:MAG: DNA-binding domain-containing protein [Bacteroidales bacterium]